MLLEQVFAFPDFRHAIFGFLFGSISTSIAKDAVWEEKLKGRMKEMGGILEERLRDMEKQLKMKEERLKDQDEMMDELVKDKDERLKDTDRRLKEKDNLLEARLQDKDSILQQKVYLIRLLYTQARHAESNMLESASKAEAVIANRILLESALIYRFSRLDYEKILPAQPWTNALPGKDSRTLETMMSVFLKDQMMDGPNLKSTVRGKLQSLQAFGVGGREEDVVQLFNNSLFSEKLSEPRHYCMHSIDSGLPPGVCIGGEEPVATGMALSMLRLQETGDTRYNILVIDSTGTPRCKLMYGRVQVIFF
jgi:hypothetical protein